MKKKFKRISIFVSIIFVSSFLFINNLIAKEYESDYRPIEGESTSIVVNELSITDLEYVDNSDTSSLSFGLIGKIYNYANEEVNYTIDIYYYNSNKEVLHHTYFEQSLESHDSKTFVRMSDVSDINSGYELEDIYYYKMVVSTSDEKDGYENILSYPSKNEIYSNYAYVIDEYNVNIKVLENNTLSITENINAYFNEEKHGIIRTIPLKNYVFRLDNTSDIVYAKISNVEVNNKYSISRDMRDYTIQIGDANKYVSGSVEYVISYDYNLGKDKASQYDELYFNIIGDEWDTVIGNISFKIEMPKEFDVSKLGFSVGERGSYFSDDVLFDVEGNTITGNYYGVLSENSGLTVRLELPEGYFSEVNLANGIGDYLLFIVPLILFIISFIIWWKYGKEEEIVKTVEFYPPENLNSLELAFFYKGKATEEDVVSLLILLASKGYIKIVEDDSPNSRIRGNNTKLIMLKEYDGNEETERIFMAGLFKKATKNKDGNKEIKLKELKYSFSSTIDRILALINRKSNKKIVFNSNSKYSKFLWIMIVISVLTIIIIPTLAYSNWGFAFTTIVLLLFYVPFWFAIIKSKIWLLSLFILFHQCAFMSIMPIAQVLVIDPFYRVGIIVGVLEVIGMVFCALHLPKRTRYGQEVLGEIEGFKEFLETAEKPQLQNLSIQNPEYFYDILPYAYVLGVSDRWINKFAFLIEKEPKWLDTYDAFSSKTLDDLIHTTMDRAVSNMTATRSSGGSSSGGFSSGGSSGGGSSGGGSGGGGGSSW